MYMKVMNPVKIIPTICLALSSAVAVKPAYCRIPEAKPDTFELVDTPKMNTLDSIEIKPGGIKDSLFLANAPSPKITVAGKTYNAAMVVDITNNILYRYEKDGKAKIAYPVSTGRDSLTVPGIYSISHVEHYPYDKAPENTLRHRIPCIFGDAGIVLQKVNPQNGTKKPTGIMIHGRYNNDKIGVHSSGGCIRCFNEIDIHNITYQAKQQPGAYILMKKY